MKLRIKKYKWLIAFVALALCAVGFIVFSASEVGEVFHDQGYVYISNIEPGKGEAITVKLRAEKGNLQSAVLRYTTDNFSADNYGANWDQIAMKKGSTDATGYYEYWEATIPGHQNTYYYHFQATANNGASVYYGARGRTPSAPWYAYSFTITPGFSTPDWAKGANWYFINPDGFYNGDIHNDAVDTETQKGIAWNSNTSGLMERYGGDLQGITDKVNYLKTLSIDAVYVNPIWDTRQNMGFGPLSYYKISPNLGTDADLINLSQTLHDNGMKLSLDAIFSYAMGDGIWANSTRNPLDKEDIFVKDSGGNVSYVWGNPQIDLTNARAKELLYTGADSVLKRYLKTPYNIDSWRFDAVNSYYTGTQGYAQIVKEITDSAKAENSDALLICEEFSRVASHNNVLSSDDWDTTYGERGYFRRWFNGVDNYGNTYNQTSFATDLLDYICRTRSLGLCTLNLYDLHDEVRITNDSKVDAAKLRALNLCQMVFVGSPCTYYGDEVGTESNEEDGFGAQRFNSFNWNEDEWDKSVYNLQCALGQLRREYSALKTGANYYEVLSDADKLMAFGRFDENGTVLAVTNQTDNTYTKTIDVKKYNVKDGAVLTDYITGSQYTVSNGKIQMTILPGGNVLVTGKKSANYGYDDVYAVNDTKAELVLSKEFAEGQALSFLQNPPQSDYTIKCKMGAATGNETAPVGVGAIQDENNLIFAGRIKIDGTSYLALGEILNGEVIVRAKVQDTAPDSACIVQLQKIGTDFSAVYSYDDTEWKTIGKNVRANYSTHKAGIYVASGASATMEYVCFGDSIRDGVTVCTPCYPEERNCEFSSNSANATRISMSIKGTKTEWEYVNGGIARKTGTGISQLAIKNRKFSDFRILVNLLPDSGSTAGITMLRATLDETIGQAYVLSLTSAGKLALSYNGTELKSVNVTVPSTGLAVAVERVGDTIWVYVGEERDFVFSVDGVSIEQGYMTYYLDGIGKILNDSVHSLTQNWTDILGDYQASFVQSGNKIVSDTKLWNDVYYRMSTFDHISAIGFTDVMFGGNVTVNQVKTDEDCYAGFVIGAKQRTVVEQSDGYYLALYKDGYVRLKRNGKELAKSNTTYGSSAKLWMMQKENHLEVYVNGVYCEELSMIIGSFDGGVVGIASYNTNSTFSELCLTDLTNEELPVKPGKYDHVISGDVKIKGGNYDAVNNVYRVTGKNAYADFATNLTGDDRCISFDVKTDGNNYEIRYRTATNAVLALRIYSNQCVAVVDGGGVSDWTQFKNTSLGSVTLSENHHVVLRSDANSVKLWINGVEMPAITYTDSYVSSTYASPYCGVYLPLKDSQSAEISNLTVWEEKSGISGCPVPNRKDQIGTITCITEPTCVNGEITFANLEITFANLAPEAWFDTTITEGDYAMSFDVETTGDALDIYCHSDGTQYSKLRLQDGMVFGYVGDSIRNSKSVDWLIISKMQNVTVSVTDGSVQLWVNGIPIGLSDGFLSDIGMTGSVQGLCFSLASGETAVVSNVQIWSKGTDEPYYDAERHVLLSDGVYTGSTIVDAKNNGVLLGGDNATSAILTTGLADGEDYYYSFTISDVTADCFHVAYLSNGSEYIALRVYPTQYVVVNQGGNQTFTNWNPFSKSGISNLNLKDKNRVTMHVAGNDMEIWMNGQKIQDFAYTKNVSAYVAASPGVYVYAGKNAAVSDITVWRETPCDRPVYASGRGRLIASQNLMKIGNSTGSAQTMALPEMPISGNEFCMSFAVDTDAQYYQVSLRGTESRNIALRIYPNQCVLLEAKKNNVQISNWPQFVNSGLGYLQTKWTSQKMYCTVKIKYNQAEFWINGQKVKDLCLTGNLSDYPGTYVAFLAYGGTYTNVEDVKIWEGK